MSEKTEEDLFRGRTLLRTPPGLRSSSTPPGNSTENSTPVREVEPPAGDWQQVGKRKKEISPNLGTLCSGSAKLQRPAVDFQRAMTASELVQAPAQPSAIDVFLVDNEPRPATKADSEEFLETALQLEQLIAKHSKTQGDIKRVSVTLLSQLRKFQRRLNQSGFESLPPAPCKCSRSSLSAAEVAERLRAVSSAQETLRLTKLDWMDSAYSATSLSGASILTDRSLTRAVLLSRSDPRDARLLSQLKNNFPNVSKIEDFLKGEQAVTVRGDFSLEVAGDEAQVTPRAIVIKYLPEFTGDDDERDAIDLLSSIMDLTKHLARGKNFTNSVALSLSPTVDITTARKLLEAAAVNFPGLKFELCAKAHRSKRRVKESQKLTAVLVNPGAKSYAAALGEMQGAIDPSTQSVRVERISQTATGYIKVLVREDAPDAAKTFAEAIKRKTQFTTSAAPIVKQTAVIIRDLTADTTSDQLRAALAVNGSPESEIHLQPFKSNRSGSSSCIARMPPDTARIHLARGSIQIGWTSCRLSEVVRVDQCARCLSFEHSTAKCSLPWSNETRCFKCAETGHLSKDCTAQPICYVCKIEGHVATSTACPAYRSKVEELRSRRRYD